jgi:uncharacterized protein (TIGR03067 family)
VQIAVLLCASCLGTFTDSAKEADTARWQGRWKLVEARRDGRPMPDTEVKKFTAVIEGDRLRILRDGQEVEGGTFKLDSKTSPRSVDFAMGKDQARVEGIYELANDTFKLCYSRPGKPRPTTFDAAADSGQSFSHWQREKK